MASTRPATVAMPDCLVHYWTMWNEADVALIRQHLDRAVSADFVFADPMHFHHGRDALEDNVRTLRLDKPRYRFVIASELDRQNDCYRYEWHMLSRQRVLLQGLDIARVDETGLLSRVDGFFGPLAEADGGDSGVPAHLRRVPDSSDLSR